MNSSATFGLELERRPVRGNRERYFYFGSTLLLLLAVFVGFKLFYLHGQAYPGRPLTPPIRTHILTHSVSMSAWMILFALQSILVVNRKYGLHKTLGKIGAVLAILVVVSGWALAVTAVRVNPPELKIWGMNPIQFLSVPLSAVVIFGVFVGIGIWKRKTPSIHRPMMFLATLAATSAAFDRITPLTALYQNSLLGSIFGPYFAPFALGCILLTIKSILAGKLDRWFAVGTVVIGLAGVAVMRWAATPVWESVAARLAS